MTRRAFLFRLGWAIGTASLPITAACQLGSRFSIGEASGQDGPAAPKPSKLDVGFNANWNEETNKAVGDLFVEWGRDNNVEVEYQVLSGGQNEKISAAIQAGQPPEIMQTQIAYWHRLGELAETTTVVQQMKTHSGGLFPVAEQSATFENGKQWGVPWGINGWPIHARKDLWAQGGGRFPKTWEEFTEIGLRIQQPPRTYAFGLATGREGDTTDNFINLTWGFGGRLADETGAPDFNSPGTVEALKLVKQWFNDFKIIPPGSTGATLTSWNNEAYQKGQALAIINPTTVYGWLALNDPDLLKNTGLYALPAGPAGSFTAVDVWMFGVFKKSRSPERGIEALAYFLEPERYQRVTEAVQGRFVPVYPDLTRTEFWSKTPEFREMIKVAETGRTSNYAGPVMAWGSEIVNRHVIPDMIQRVVQGGEDPAGAVAWAHGEMKRAYEELG